MNAKTLFENYIFPYGLICFFSLLFIAVITTTIDGLGEVPGGFLSAFFLSILFSVIYYKINKKKGGKTNGNTNNKY